MRDESSLTWETIKEAVDRLKPLHPPEAVLTSPMAEAVLRKAMPPADESSLTGPFGMKIYVVDWVGEDEYFMGDPKLIQNLVKIGEGYGGPIARALLNKFSREGE